MSALVMTWSNGAPGTQHHAYNCLQLISIVSTVRWANTPCDEPLAVRVHIGRRGPTLSCQLTASHVSDSSLMAIPHAIYIYTSRLLVHSICSEGVSAVMCNRGAQLDPVNAGGVTPLLSAIFFGHTEVVELILLR